MKLIEIKMEGGHWFMAWSGNAISWLPGYQWFTSFFIGYFAYKILSSTSRKATRTTLKESNAHVLY